MPGSKPLAVRLERLQQELRRRHSQGKHCPVLLGAVQLQRQRKQIPQQRPKCHKTARNRHGRWVRLPRPVHLAHVSTHDERSWLSSCNNSIICSPSALPPSELDSPTGALISAGARVNAAMERAATAEAQVTQLQGQLQEERELRVALATSKQFHKRRADSATVVAQALQQELTALEDLYIAAQPVLSANSIIQRRHTVALEDHSSFIDAVLPVHMEHRSSRRFGGKG